jgi:hypothetical protein
MGRPASARRRPSGSQPGRRAPAPERHGSQHGVLSPAWARLNEIIIGPGPVIACQIAVTIGAAVASSRYLPDAHSCADIIASADQSRRAHTAWADEIAEPASKLAPHVTGPVPETWARAATRSCSLRPGTGAHDRLRTPPTPSS